MWVQPVIACSRQLILRTGWLLTSFVVTTAAWGPAFSLSSVENLTAVAHFQLSTSNGFPSFPSLSFFRQVALTKFVPQWLRRHLLYPLSLRVAQSSHLVFRSSRSTFQHAFEYFLGLWCARTLSTRFSLWDWCGLRWKVAFYGTKVLSKELQSLKFPELLVRAVALSCFTWQSRVCAALGFDYLKKFNLFFASVEPSQIVML